MQPGTGRALRRAIAAARRLRGRETQRAGEIAHAQYVLLSELSELSELAELGERGELAAGELGAAAELAPATVIGMLDHLADAGFVVRARSEHDRRLVVSHLTDAGRARVAGRRARLEPLSNAAITDFDATELAAATAVLDRLRIFFENARRGRSSRRRRPRGGYRLEAADLAERRRDPGDRRRHLVRLTPTGEEALARADEAHERIEAKILHMLSPQERATLRRLLALALADFEPSTTAGRLRRRELAGPTDRSLG